MKTMNPDMIYGYVHIAIIWKLEGGMNDEENKHFNNVCSRSYVWHNRLQLQK